MYLSRPLFGSRGVNKWWRGEYSGKTSDVESKLAVANLFSAFPTFTEIRRPQAFFAISLRADAIRFIISRRPTSISFALG